MVESENLTVKISALQHYSYCPRQCGLIYLEDIYDENIYTLQGNDVHEKIHEEASETRGDNVKETALTVWSESLGIRGQADLVEFYPREGEGKKYERIVPIEYKRGRERKREPDEIQLCAQALCLEEMFGEEIHEAYIYHHSSRTRRAVDLSAKLRERTKRTIKDVRDLLTSHELPDPANDSRCDNCSLVRSCMPEYIDAKGTLKNYSEKLFMTQRE